MTKKNYRFKGHESFVLRDGWIHKGLRAIEKDPFVFTKNSGADILGVGTNMAKSIRYWLRCANLSEENGKQGVQLSAMGKLILEKDTYLEDVFSLLVIHCNIVKNKAQATAWNLFFYHYDEMEFTKEELVKSMITMVGQMEDIPSFSEKSVESDCEAILHMYVKKTEREIDPEEKNVSPFGIFELLKQKDDVYWRNQPALQLIPAEIVWYLLPDCVSKENAVSIDDLLVGEGSPGRILNLKRTGLIEKLEELETQGILQMNRTAGLDMVYLNEEKKKEDIIKEYFQKKQKGEHRR